MCDKFLSNKGNKLVPMVCLAVFLFGCTETIYFYPPDESQCITVITENWTRLRGKPGRFRYIIAGKHHNVPEENFVKLAINSGDRYRDALYICWTNDQYEWEAVVHNGIVIESKLDTTRFNFSTSLPNDDRGIPAAKNFAKETCDVFSFDLQRLLPEEGGTIVEFK